MRHYPPTIISQYWVVHNLFICCAINFGTREWQQTVKLSRYPNCFLNRFCIYADVLVLHTSVFFCVPGYSFFAHCKTLTQGQQVVSGGRKARYYMSCSHWNWIPSLDRMSFMVAWHIWLPTLTKTVWLCISEIYYPDLDCIHICNKVLWVGLAWFWSNKLVALWLCYLVIPKAQSAITFTLLTPFG